MSCETGAWSLGGNLIANSTTQFLGSTNNQALELRVNNQRALRLVPNAISPNVIGGHAANGVTSGVRGAAIGGGGLPVGQTDPDFIPFGGLIQVNEAPNRVTDAYGSIGGG